MNGDDTLALERGQSGGRGRVVSGLTPRENKH